MRRQALLLPEMQTDQYDPMTTTKGGPRPDAGRLTTRRKPGPVPQGRAPFNTWLRPELRQRIDQEAAKLAQERGCRVTRADILEEALSFWLLSI